MSRVSYQTIRVMLRCFLQFEASPSSGQELRDMGQERFQVKSCPIWMLGACETDRLSSLIKASEILCRGDNSQTIHLYIPGISAYGCIWYTDIYGIWSKMMGIEVSEQAQWIKSIFFDACNLPLHILWTWSSNSLCEESPPIPNQRFNSSFFTIHSWSGWWAGHVLGKRHIHFWRSDVLGSRILLYSTVRTIPLYWVYPGQLWSMVVCTTKFSKAVFQAQRWRGGDVDGKLNTSFGQGPKIKEIKASHPQAWS